MGTAELHQGSNESPAPSPRPPSVSKEEESGKNEEITKDIDIVSSCRCSCEPVRYTSTLYFLETPTVFSTVPGPLKGTTEFGRESPSRIDQHKEDKEDKARRNKRKAITERVNEYMKYCEMIEELGGGYRILLQSIEAEHDFIKLLGDLRMKSVEAKLVKVYIDGRLHSRANDGITLLKVCGTKIMMHSEKKITPRKIRKLTRKEEANEKYGRYIKDSYELLKGLSKEDMISFYGNDTVTAYPVLFDNNQNAQQINNPNYSLYDNRLLTLRDWPVYSTRLPGKVFDIAKSGLYYNGTTKDLRCFHCDIELRTWDHGMDPAEEHARKNPNCPFLQNDPAHADLARQFLLQQISGQNSGVQAQQ